MICTPATGSEIITIFLGVPAAVSGPNPVKVASCRDLPKLSRYIDTCDVRCSTDPSCSVSVVSDVAVAENGAPFTSLPPCIPSKPMSSIGAPKGGPSGPCRCACNAAALNITVPPRTKRIFIFEFIVASPLLSLILSPTAIDRSRGESLSVFFLRETHGFRQAVVSDQQIHLDPFTSALFIHWQTQRTERSALHPHTQYGRLFGFVCHGSRQRRKVSRIISTGKRSGQRCLLLPIACLACHHRGRHSDLPFCRFQMADLLPISPVHCADKNRGGSQRPGCGDRSTPHDHGATASTKFLPQAHLDSRRRTSFQGFLTQRSQLFSCRFPRFLQCRTARAMTQVRQGRRPFQRIRGVVAVQIQYNRFYLFAVHCIFSKCFQNSLTSPLSCAEGHPSAFPVSPAEERAHGAGEIVSCQ